MNRIVLVFTCISIALVGMAEVNNGEPQHQPTEKAKLAKMKLQVRAGGGKLEKPGTKLGQITIVNTQESANEEWIKSAVSYLAKETRLNVVFQNGAFSFPTPKLIGNISVYIIDDNNLPPTLIAAESRWGVVNVANLKSNKLQFYEARVKKQISRVFSMLCGGMSSNFSLSVASPVTCVADIDAMPGSHIPFDVANKMPMYLQKFGVSPAVITTYRKACQEGWAPAPTNDVQKTIWDMVHTMPTEPIKIKPETTKQK